MRYRCIPLDDDALDGPPRWQLTLGRRPDPALQEDVAHLGEALEALGIPGVTKTDVVLATVSGEDPATVSWAIAIGNHSCILPLSLQQDVDAWDDGYESDEGVADDYVILRIIAEVGYRYDTAASLNEAMAKAIAAHVLARLPPLEDAVLPKPPIPFPVASSCLASYPG